MVNRAAKNLVILRRQRSLLAVAALVAGSAASFLLHQHGYGLAGGLLLSGLVAFTAWAAFCFPVWPREADHLAEDLGLMPPPPSPGDAFPISFEETAVSSRSAVETVGASFRLQLDLLRTSLGLTGVALLWPDAAGKDLRLRGLSSLRKDIRQGPFPIGSGITGILGKGRDEVVMAPVSASFNGLPYYRRRGSTGSLYAVRIAVAGDLSGGILCADRETAAPWKAAELATFRLAARRLAFDIAMGRQFIEMHRERGLYHRASIGLRELTAGLGLDSAIDAALKAVRAIVAPDFLALALVEDGRYRVLRAEGGQAAKLLKDQFPLAEGLVGQALRYARPLPESAEHHGATPVFGPHRLPAELRSLLVLPLRKEPGTPLGALVVAARKQGVFTRLRRELLELIAHQVAVKIDLALAHEQINQLATTDSLTGLANHRAFQQAFRNMLQRARRQSTSFCLLLGDVDHFKRVNDTYGHPFGDTVLQAVAAVLGRTVRDTDLAARYGGEEFALLLEDSNREGGRRLAERTRRSIEALELRHQEEQVRVTLSLGLAVFPEDGEEIPLLIQRADQALYQAKRQGRNRIVAWSPPMEQAGTGK